MKVKFQEDSSLKSGELQIEVKALQEDSTVKKLISYLNKFGKRDRNLLPIKTSDRIVTIKREELIKIEVQSTTLTYYTTNEVIKTTGRLYQVLDDLNEDFVQVSRHSVMIAILANNLKTDVSRRYLPDLEKELGL